jgi:hypothetical protein
MDTWSLDAREVAVPAGAAREADRKEWATREAARSERAGCAPAWACMVISIAYRKITHASW